MSREVETDDISVEYEVVNKSFSHAFGIEKIKSYEIIKIKAYIPALNSWLDVSHMNEFQDKATELVEDKINEVI